MKLNEKIGKILYQLRVKAGESQEKVASSCDISIPAYTRYENNQREPKASIAIRLAQHFGVSVEYLYDVERNPAVVPRLPDETELISIYRSLSRDRKDELLQYAGFMLMRQSDEKGRSAGAG